MRRRVTTKPGVYKWGNAGAFRIREAHMVAYAQRQEVAGVQAQTARCHVACVDA